GDGDWPGWEAEPLFSADLFPVCTGTIAARLARPSDLSKETLLQVAHSPDEWPLWLAAAGVKLRASTLGPRFDNYAMALQAAVDGMGVAIGMRPYVEDDIAAGRLVAPFRLGGPKGRAVGPVFSPVSRDEPGPGRFRRWPR